VPATVISRVKSTIRANDHPYLNGAWEPVFDEIDATDMVVIGTIPIDIEGVYLRTSENPVHEPLGRYHPFDGDGMIHSMHFKDGKATYCNRFVQTRGLQAETEAGEALWSGLAVHPILSKRPGECTHSGLKDASSTDVVVHAGKALSTFYQCGDGYQLDPVTLAPMGTVDWKPEGGISAHTKVDEATGELMFFNYSVTAPYMHYGVVGPDDKLKHYIPVDLPGPRLPHDMAFSTHYSILNDMPLFWKPELLSKGIHAVSYYPELGARFAVLPRYGNAEDIRWFMAAPTYVLHWLNAYEDGNELILDGYFQENPMPGRAKDAPEKYASLMPYVDLHALQSRLHRWRFNLDTGETSEAHLDERVLEFGTFNQKYAGRKYRYCYSQTSKPGWFLLTGLVKHDLETGESSGFEYGAERYGSEAPFVPRIGAKDEDDGYLVSFVTDMKTKTSECILLDAKNIEAGPVCRIILPHRISSGTHAAWAGSDALKAGIT